MTLPQADALPALDTEILESLIGRVEVSLIQAKGLPTMTWTAARTAIPTTERTKWHDSV